MIYVPALNGLRAFAVMGVLLSHYHLGENYDFIVNMLPWGHIGVRLFFVLSGFLITSILINCKNIIEKECLSPVLVLRQFYIRRFLRIFPLFYGVIFLLYFFDFGNIKDVIIYHVFFLSNISSALTGTLIGFPPLIEPATAHFWSLAVEEQFYLIWPLMVLFISKKRLLILLVFIIFMSPILRFLWFFSGYDLLYSYLPLRVDTLGLGACLALFRSGEFQPLQGKSFLLKIVFYFSLAFLLGSFLSHALGIWYRPRLIVMDFFEGIVYAFLMNFIIDAKCKRLNKILENYILNYLGSISYGIYILHAFTPHIYSYFFSVKFESGLLMFCIYTLMTVILAGLSFSLYESQVNRLKKYFPYDYSKSTKE